MDIETQRFWSLSHVSEAFFEAWKKFAPARQIKNPILFCVYVSAILSSLLAVQSFMAQGQTSLNFVIQVSIWLWLTLYFSNFSEALAEARGRAQAKALQGARQNVIARKLSSPHKRSAHINISANELVSGDIVLVEAGEIIPADGEVIRGIASVNESAVTGESAPVIRESGGDASGVTGGTKVISDWLMIRVSVDSGKSYIDKMLGLVEGTLRQRTPNELSLSILLSTLTLLFLVVCSCLLPYSLIFSPLKPIPISILIALFVCLAPTTIGGLLSAIGIAGMDRMIQANVLALSGRAVEAAGDIDVLLLDKTGTITIGDRQATAFYPLESVRLSTLIKAAQLASLCDETPEGKSILKLAKTKYHSPAPKLLKADYQPVPFTAATRMSGINLKGKHYRKGAPDALIRYLKAQGEPFPKQAHLIVNKITTQGATAFVVVQDKSVLGVIELKDKIKPQMQEKFAELRSMGIRSILITGDHTLTAAAMAAEAGVDDFHGEASAEGKLNFVRGLQAAGHRVAMSGDGTNDAPALAQSNVALAMSSGTQAAKQAANLIDFDSDPSKIIQIVEIGKQLQATRGVLSVFSFSNDMAKYFVLLPPVLSFALPSLSTFNVMHLSSPSHAILATLIFNAVVMIGMLPVALYGVGIRREKSAKRLKSALLTYGLGGAISPFLGIKLIDMLLTL